MRLYSIPPLLVTLALAVSVGGTAPTNASGGPGEISAAPAYTSSGTKTIAVDPNTTYANYQVWTRHCATGDVSTCTESWISRLNTYDATGVSKQVNVDVTVDNAEDCESYGPTFQIKFTSSGFGTPENTVYHTSDVCDPIAFER